MEIKQIVKDMERSGYTRSRILSYIRGVYDIEISPANLATLVQGDNGGITEYQNDGKRKWQRLRDICSKEKWLEYYNPGNGTIGVVQLAKDFNFSRPDIDLLHFMYHNESKIDCFSYDVNQKILEADRCARCGTTEKKLYTHHIVPGGGENIENGVAVCRRCHKYIHEKINRPMKIGAYDITTWDDFLEDYNLANIYKKPGRIEKSNEDAS
jgi:hypothetical protein